ncbi:MAG: bifunctional helix-turn-helix transcriptional regulator/GNAT family N-acetyltransferase, partial [Pseudomonadota bacterium]
LMQDGARIYQELGGGFEPRWFSVVMYLHRHGPTSITALAKGLGVSHPGINKIANELIETKLVAPYRDRHDKRKRVLALTSLGREKISQLEPEWRKIRQALQTAIDEDGGEFLSRLGALEQSFEQKSFYQRFHEQARTSFETKDIAVESFDPELADAFRTLNEDWIRHYFKLEDADKKVLDNPQAVIDQGGDILFAVVRPGTEVLGTCALLNHSDGQFELAKMAVAETAKGKNLGALLGKAIIERAKSMGAKRLFLESNTKLTPAISLYRKLGFVERPFPYPSDYSRADIYMELDPLS